METKWTKGKWTKHPYSSTLGTLISFGSLGKGENVAAVMAQRDAVEGKANADLFFAAPDLYEALRACQLQLLQSKDRHHEYIEEALEMAHAALLKARGGTQ